MKWITFLGGVVAVGARLQPLNRLSWKRRVEKWLAHYSLASGFRPTSRGVDHRRFRAHGSGWVLLWRCPGRMTA